MKLLRVQVPNFRVLKNVDISFEPDFTPQVFPLGSLNGGGKSTLLQLIFVLLHCSAHKERHQFIANMLDSVIIPEGETSQILAKIDLLDDEGKKIELEFTVCNDGYLQQLELDPIYNTDYIFFRIIPSKGDELFIKIIKKEKEIENLELQQEYYQDNEIQSQQLQIFQEMQKLELELESLKNQEQSESMIRKVHGNTKPVVKNIIENFESNQQLYITKSANQSIGLISDFSNISDNSKRYKKLLNLISTKIFLSAPINQIYLFLAEDQRDALFSKNKGSYDNALTQTKRTLLNFKTYDVFSPEIIINLFENARNQDFKTLVESGENGNHYKSLLEELRLFTDKKIILQIGEDSKVISIIFKSKEGIKLKPEDLSHGELKRLSLYVWLKTMPKGGNIVLMDEIENGFHPQWQRYIADDLAEWQESNQYILATHSYELCRGVSFEHIKELSPELMLNNEE
ncbi:MAG: AAA family ATPase [Methylococcales bacterium]|nr:AAA family ATPase [Methylococcales bacterium]